MLLRSFRLAFIASGLYLTSTYLSHASELFPLQAVRLSDGPFLVAQQANVNYLMALDPDKMLAPYLREAGLQVKAKAYGNWESSGLDGHIGGHYLSALSLAYAATGNAELKQRLDYMLAELRKAQLQNKDGYLGGIPDGKSAWQQIKQGHIKVDLFALSDRWVPLYNLHKTFAGLRDAFQIGQSGIARTMLIELTNWVADLVAGLTEQQIQQMLIAEHGGMNEIFADVYAITGEQKYLKLAKQFSHQSILQPLLQGEDKLNGLHANTQIPKVIGFLRVAELNGDKSWRDAADFFWHNVTEKRTVSIGGNSVREHFHDADDFSSMLDSVEGPETCNTYNMLKLSKLLYQDSLDTQYLDYYERATYNHILSSQHPDTGGLVYFTPMRPGHYRTYSQVDTSMWCCVGSGIENHSKYGELIYAHQGAELFVNLFIPSRLDWQQQGLSVELDTLFPDQDQLSIRVSPKADYAGQALTLSIRQPSWLSAQNMQLTINGQAVKTHSTHKGYLSVTRRWQAGDTLTLDMRIRPHLEALPDGSQHFSVLYGPVVLAEKVSLSGDQDLAFFANDDRMGHVASGPVCAPEALPVIVGDTETFLQGLTRQPGPYLAFSAGQGIQRAQADPLTQSLLIPFYRIHESRYQLYWPQMQPAQYQAFVQQAQRKTSLQTQLARQTLDQINPGEQQPETEHDFEAQDSRAGINGQRHWRDASGWFSYQLADPDKQAKILRLTYFSGDKGRQFSIWFNAVKLADVVLGGEAEQAFYDIDYPLTDEMLEMAKKGKHRVKFVAADNSIAGGVYGVRLLKAKAAD